MQEKHLSSIKKLFISESNIQLKIYNKIITFNILLKKAFLNINYLYLL